MKLRCEVYRFDIISLTCCGHIQVTDYDTLLILTPSMISRVDDGHQDFSVIGTSDHIIVVVVPIAQGVFDCFHQIRLLHNLHCS